MDNLVIFLVIMAFTVIVTWDARKNKIPIGKADYSLNNGASAWFLSIAFWTVFGIERPDGDPTRSYLAVVSDLLWGVFKVAPVFIAAVAVLPYYLIHRSSILRSRRKAAEASVDKTRPITGRHVEAPERPKFPLS